MAKKSLIHKIFALLVIFLLLAGTLSFFLIPKQAQAADFFEQDDGGLTFTDYEGGIVELTKDAGYDQSLVQSEDARSYILRIVNFALGFLGLAAVIVIIYGGVLYVTSAGETDSTDKGKNAIKFATIGLLIVLGSFAFVNTVIRGAGGGGDGGGGQYVVGPNNGASFNASATEVRTIAREIYSNFLLFAESYEDIKNIQADLQKPQLDYQQANDVSKENQLTFLTSTKDKLLNIRARVPKFSQTYAQINEINRGLESYIAQISIIGSNQTDGPDTIIEKRFATWERFRNDFLSPDTSSNIALASLVEPIRTDFLQILDEKIAALAQINSRLRGIQPAQEGDIANLYSKLSDEYSAFRTQIESWTIDNPSTAIDQAGERLYRAIQSTIAYEEALRDLKGVVARLRADVVTGNAPLYVNFDVLESVDPAGGNITEVDWSGIKGNVTLDGTVLPIGDAVDCNLPANSEEVVGSTFRQCIFRHPGTYNATVVIESNDPTKYVSGLSTLTIKVNPPTTKINMSMAFGDKEVEVIEYYDSGIVKVDKDLIPVTLEEAKSGLNFITDIDNVTNYRWDFGDGTIQEGGQDLKNINKIYEIAGRYLVTLEVTNSLNQVDRKIFTLDVGNVAGRISVSPVGDLYINTPVRFSAEQSTAVGGSIRGYEWSITPEGGQPLDLGANSGRSNFNYQFKEPGVYFAKLRVVSQAGVGEAPAIRLVLKSKPPVAVLKQEIPETNQPSTVHFNAAGSFDPDGPVDNLLYEWRITPESQNGANWQVVGGGEINGLISQRDPIVKFKNPGDYDISLKVIDGRTRDAEIDEESDTETLKLKIDKVLDIDWADDQEVTAVVDESGFATVNFGIISENAVAYEVDYGDGDSENGQIAGGRANFQHVYNSAGRYEVEVTAYDEDDNDNRISRRFFIGGGDTPVARASVEVDGNQILAFGDPIRVSTSDIVTFDASESKNTDGTGRDLIYQWNFGDLGTSSKRRETHRYRELSPVREGYYTVKLRVSDADDPGKFDEDEIYINVINEAPYFSSIQASLVDSDQQGKPTTPTEIELRSFGATDEDGQVVKYKWWYFDVDDPSEQLGIRITDTSSTRLTIGTRGRQGQEVQYGFGLEITDDGGLSYSNQEEIESGNYSTIEVVNGANALPVAKFAANATSVFVGDKVLLTSSSTDADGEITTYIWDLEGDGFFNNAPTKDSSIEYNFPAKNTDGINVRLKVIDDKGGESTSDPVRIIVDSNAEQPTAAFNYRVIDGSKGMKVQFTNNSRADAEAGAQIIAYHWDFDTAANSPAADSDGDGVKDNDIDSNVESPARLYTKPGTYQVKLTVTDSQGNQDSVTNPVQIPLSNPPTAAFKYQIIDGKIVFENNSTPDPESAATLEKYIWDFDLDSEFPSADSDGDGDSENDKDSELKSPVYVYPNPGTYQVKLTVIDSQGTKDEVTNEVIFTPLSGLGQNNSGSTTGIGASTGLGTSSSNIKALLTTTPKPSADSIIYLNGTSAQIKFDFRESLGEIAFYVIDKDILVDSNGDGIADNDEDFKTVLPGTWTTNYPRGNGRKVARLTVVDRGGRIDSVSQEIIFQ